MSSFKIRKSLSKEFPTDKKPIRYYKMEDYTKRSYKMQDKIISPDGKMRRLSRPQFTTQSIENKSSSLSKNYNSKLTNCQRQFSLPKIGKPTFQSPKLLHRNKKEDPNCITIALKPVPSIDRKLSKNISFGWRVQSTGVESKQYININKVEKIYSVISDKIRNQWLDTLAKLKMQFMQMDEKIQILSPQFWPVLFSKFQRYHLNNDQRVQFLELISKFFQSDFGYSNIKNQFQFCEQMGKKMQQLQNRIHFKHKYCLQHIKFMIESINHKQSFYPIHFPQLRFNLQESQIFQMAAIVRSFCQNNMDAFAFLALYFQISLKTNKNRYSSQEAQQAFEKLLKKLEKIYPANQQSINSNNQSWGLDSIPFSQKLQPFQFKKIQKSHYDQLKQELIRKAEKAKLDETVFRTLVQDLCYKYGYSFKTGVKIKNPQSKSSIFRSVEKLMAKYQLEFNQLKKQLAQKSQNTSKKFSQQKIQFQISEVQNKIGQILQRQKSILIDAKDLLRGKCTFSKIEQIIETAQNLKVHIIKQGFKLLELKNRLSKNTKDVVLIIKLPHSIAQLQLVLKLDSVSNQFNHKLFELTRSKVYTSITNLFIHNERWCQIFFTDQMEMFEQIVSMYREPQLGDDIKFKKLHKDVINFKKKFLEPNQIKFQKNFQMKRQERLKILQKIKQINLLLEKLISPENKNSEVKKKQRKLNQINFYKYFDYEKVLENFQNVEQKQLEDNLVLLKLKGDVLKDHQKPDQSLNCYKKYLSIQKKNKVTNKNIANVLHSMGQIYDVKQDYNNAIQFYVKSLEIKQNLSGEDSLDVAASLHGIGSVYSNMKNKDNYVKALEYYEKALKIRQNIIGKQNIQVATSLNNIGVVYRRKGDYLKALDYLQKSLQIREKILGKQSVDAAASLYHIGLTYKLKEDYLKANQYLQKSLQIRQKILGKDSISVAQTHHYISFVYEELQDLEKAARSIKVAHSIFKKYLKQQHSKTHLAYQQFMDIQKKLEKKNKLEEVSPVLMHIYKKGSSLQRNSMMQRSQNF